MPTPKPNESEEDYVRRCIPVVMEEGTAKDGAQAAAICHSMYAEHNKEKSVRTRRMAVRDPSGYWEMVVGLVKGRKG